VIRGNAAERSGVPCHRPCDGVGGAIMGGGPADRCALAVGDLIDPRFFCNLHLHGSSRLAHHHSCNTEMGWGDRGGKTPYVDAAAAALLVVVVVCALLVCCSWRWGGGAENLLFLPCICMLYLL